MFQIIFFYGDQVIIIAANIIKYFISSWSFIWSSRSLFIFVRIFHFRFFLQCDYLPCLGHPCLNVLPTLCFSLFLCQYFASSVSLQVIYEFFYSFLHHLTEIYLSGFHRNPVYCTFLLYFMHMALLCALEYCVHLYLLSQSVVIGALLSIILV